MMIPASLLLLIPSSFDSGDCQSDSSPSFYREASIVFKTTHNTKYEINKRPDTHGYDEYQSDSKEPHSENANESEDQHNDSRSALACIESVCPEHSKKQR